MAEVLCKEDLREGPQQLCTKPRALCACANDSGWGKQEDPGLSGQPNNEEESHRERHPLLT